MQDILNDLGQLVLGSVPTMILFLFLVAAYHFILYRPLKRTRAARFDRTQGALERAHAAVAAADSWVDRNRRSAVGGLDKSRNHP